MGLGLVHSCFIPWIAYLGGIFPPSNRRGAAARRWLGRLPWGWGVLDDACQVREVFLEHIGASAEVQRFGSQARLIVLGEHDHPDVGKPLPHCEQSVEAIHRAHAQIHQHPVRPRGRTDIQGFRPVGGFVYHARQAGNDLADEPAYPRIVVSNEDLIRHSPGLSQNARRTGIRVNTQTGVRVHTYGALRVHTDSRNTAGMR